VKQFLEKVYTRLRSTDTTNFLIKIGIQVVLLFIGFFFQPFVIVAAAMLVLFMIFENDVKSFYYIVFFYCFTSGFIYHTYDLFYVPVVFFVVMHVCRYLITVKFRVHKDVLFVSVFVLSAYFVLAQLIGRPDFERVGMAVHLLFLLFVCVKNLDKLKLEAVAFFLAGGILLSSLLGLFRGLIPRLSLVIPEFEGRFSALMVNPNSLYMIVLCAIAAILVLNVQNKMNKYLFSGVFAALTVIGIATLSRAFILIYFLLVLAFGLVKVLKARKNKVELKKTLLFIGVLCIAVTILFLIPPFQAIISRFASLTNLDSQQSVDTLYDPGRWGLWKLYIETWASSAKNIIFGLGFASPIGPNGVKATSAHNVLVVLLAQTGLVGLALFGFMLFCVFKSVSSARRFGLDTWLPALALIGFCMVETALFKFTAYLFVVLIMLCMLPLNKTNETSI